jgi:DNA-binding FadR family transcriptional regulator
MLAAPRGVTIDVPTSVSAPAKRAERVADRIVEDVMALGWPVGQVLGSEAELLERYKVSRAVFREAVRIVEHQQVVQTRRGPTGGLVITEPTVSAVIDAVVLYLHRVDARLDELFEARILLEAIASELASTRLGAHDRARLDALIDGEGDAACDPRTLHALVASSTGNPALELFVEVLSRVTLLYSPEGLRLEEVAAELSHAHVHIARAVVAGDPELAARRMRIHLEAEADFLRARRSTRQLLPKSVILSGSTTGKGAEGVARNIARTILAEGLQPGQLVGTEPELIEREGVSRALLREAVRLLEHHQIARMRRGPGGGLFVVEPSTSAVTDIAAIYLVRRGMQLAELAELRTGVEVAIADLAAARIDDDGVARMQQALEHEATTTDADLAEAVHDLHAAVASAADNRVLQLVALVLIRLARLHQIERLADSAQEQVREEVFRAHKGIAAAVASGDRALATRRMRLHLDALAAAMR